MHGIIHAQLKQYVVDKHGNDAWQAVLKEAGLDHKVYLANTTYEDADAIAIVMAGSKLTNTPPDDIMEAFGEFIVPALLSTFGAMVKPAWKTMELLLNTEETIHKAVRV